MHMSTRLFVSCLALGTATAVLAQDAGVPKYLLPPPAIVSILEAPPPPTVTLSPSRQDVVVLERRSMPSIAELSRPMLRLAGHRIDPQANGPHRRPDTVGLVVKRLSDGSERRIAVPAGAVVMPIGFSPDGARYAYGLVGDTGISLAIAQVATATSREVAGLRLNATLRGTPCEWLHDSSALVCTAVPTSRAGEPARPAAPSGPNVQESSGKAAPVATFQDLLTNAHDEALFEHYFTSQPVIVAAASGAVQPVARPGIYSELTASTSGEYLLTERLMRPFSRQVPAERFPLEVQVWSRASGTPVRTIAVSPLADAVPINGVRTGPRSYRWHALEPATVVWAEALDNGDPKAQVPFRDRVVRLAAPFGGQPTEVIKTEFRFQDIAWTDAGLALVTEYDRAKRWTRTSLLGTDQPVRVLFDRSAEDAYKNHGRPIVRPGANTILQSGDAIFLAGPGASPQGERPFLDRLDLTSLATTRLFQSGATSYESVTGLVTDDGARVLTRYESRTEPPNDFVRDLLTGTRTALTAYTDPAPQLALVDKRLITYARKDGVKLSATLYLPPGYKRGDRLPMLMWAYPREFTNSDAASQVTGSPNRFTTIRGASHLLLLMQGYAILDNPAMPIVGPGETANDTYVEQLVASAEAAVNTVVEMGVADRERLAIGGHSYGAFMTLNLLAHSDLFRAGVARSGAYNRTLTPFGFQNESRTFWEVPDIYARMSPIWYAHAIKEPVLLVHGEADDNSGTFPIQSERLYAALKGNGATVRYVTLPSEAHGYLARESVLHTVAEMLNWCDKHVKAAKPRTPTATEPSQ
jgi:dipeptidyl aminopeptidase/acylaminoacyl peptidase